VATNRISFRRFRTQRFIVDPRLRSSPFTAAILPVYRNGTKFACGHPQIASLRAQGRSWSQITDEIGGQQGNGAPRLLRFARYGVRVLGWRS
jgi:hypothetical protein